MRKISNALIVTAVAAVAPATAALAGAAPASAATVHRMTLFTAMYTCDFQHLDYVSFAHPGTSTAEITSDGNTAVAHINMTSGTNDAQYVVRLIPAPHGAMGCQAGDPSITTGALQTDSFGNGSATVQAPVRSGATGMWVAVDLPSAHSQTPSESYSSNFIAPV
jgi:hypothetical protein